MSNALVTGLLAVAYCRAGCNASRLKQAAFQPPDATYRVHPCREEEEEEEASCPAAAAVTVATTGRGVHPVRRCRLALGHRLLAQLGGLDPTPEELRCYLLRTRLGSMIPALFLAAPRNSTRRYPLVLLYSHGNAVDLGGMLPTLLELTHELGVSVFAYEYSGYGDSRGVATTSERQTYADIEAAYEMLCSLGTPASHVVAYGQSIGSGPTCDLASKRRTGGVVLHSAFTTALGVLTQSSCHCCRPSRTLCCCDMYRNSSKLARFSSPVLILHGRLDSVVDVSHAERLLAQCPAHLRREPHLVDMAGHDDVREMDMLGYRRAMNAFLDGVETALSQEEQEESRA